MTTACPFNSFHFRIFANIVSAAMISAIPELCSGPDIEYPSTVPYRTFRSVRYIILSEGDINCRCSSTESVWAMIDKRSMRWEGSGRKRDLWSCCTCGVDTPFGSFSSSLFLIRRGARFDRTGHSRLTRMGRHRGSTQWHLIFISLTFTQCSIDLVTLDARTREEICWTFKLHRKWNQRFHVRNVIPNASGVRGYLQ